MNSPHFRFGRSLESWISIQSVTDHSIRLRYGLPPSAPVLHANLTGGHIQWTQTGNANGIGQLVFTPLPAATEFSIQVQSGSHFATLSAATLPAPQSEKLFTLMLLADPHLSCLSKDLYGRLHSVSSQLLEKQLQLAKSRNCDLILVPGDFTDEAQPEEYQRLDSALIRNRIPLWATPGNHDLGADRGESFRIRFGAGVGLRQYRGFQLAAFDTSDGRFDKAANRAVMERLDPSLPLIAMTHYQLFADEWIPDANKVISDQVSARPWLDKLAGFRGILYVGHKNVASLIRPGRLYQLNLPQLTHFPAGSLEAEVYQDHIRHTFLPIADETLNERSRLGTEAAPYHSHPLCELKSAYRDAYTQRDWNKVIEL